MSIINKRQKKNVKGRIYFLAFLFFLITGFILSRLYFLQVLSYQTYHALAQNQYQVFQELLPNRGKIFLKDKDKLYPLAINREYKMVYLVPREIEDEDKVIFMLSSILNLKKEIIKNKISDKNSFFKICKHRLNSDEIEKIKRAKLKGVHLMNENFRYYPGQQLASQVVGYVGNKGDKTQVGCYGLEAYWEKELKGKPGSLFQEKDAAGRWISLSDRKIKKAENGVNLITTIERTIQYETEKVLQESIEKYQADKGTAIVVDVRTGKILALANFPNFNPNQYNQVTDMKLFLNPAVSEAYEAGSVFKSITLAIGLDTKKISPQTTYIDTGSVFKSGYTIKNSDEKSHGKQTMTEVLEKSLNTGSIFVEKLIGNKTFLEYLKDFGFGKKTGIELPGELKGNLNNLNYLKRDINFYTASFGQGIAITPLQLIMAYATLANHGKLMKPQIIDKIIYPNGKIEIIQPEFRKQVITDETSRLISEMLRKVVTNGHGKRADVAGYLVGGKTGTAQIAKKNDKGYKEDAFIGTFVGYAPTNDPRFAVLVKIDNPKNVQWAESSAAPTFSKIMEFVLKYYKVKPSLKYDKQ